MLLSATVVSVFLQAGALDKDPSLYVAYAVYDAPFAMMISGVAPTVIDECGVEITWDDQLEEFSATINGQSVHDLVTSTTAEGDPSFAGKFTPGGDPTIFGYFDGSATSYTLYLSTPNNNTYSYEISNSTGYAPTVNVTRVCDCSDSGSLDCGPASDCNNSKECGDNDGECTWSDVTE